MHGAVIFTVVAKSFLLLWTLCLTFAAGAYAGILGARELIVRHSLSKAYLTVAKNNINNFNIYGKELYIGSALITTAGVIALLWLIVK